MLYSYIFIIKAEISNIAYYRFLKWCSSSQSQFFVVEILPTYWRMCKHVRGISCSWYAFNISCIAVWTSIYFDVFEKLYKNTNIPNLCFIWLWWHYFVLTRGSLLWRCNWTDEKLKLSLLCCHSNRFTTCQVYRFNNNNKALESKTSWVG